MIIMNLIPNQFLKSIKKNKIHRIKRIKGFFSCEQEKTKEKEKEKIKILKNNV